MASDRYLDVHRDDGPGPDEKRILCQWRIVLSGGASRVHSVFIPIVDPTRARRESHGFGGNVSRDDRRKKLIAKQMLGVCFLSDPRIIDVPVRCASTP